MHVKPEINIGGMRLRILGQINLNWERPVSLQSLSIHLTYKVDRTFLMLIIFRPPCNTGAYITTGLILFQPCHKNSFSIFWSSLTWAVVMKEQLQIWIKVEKNKSFRD